MNTAVIISLLLILLPLCALALPDQASVDEYDIDADGGLIYDALRREAETTGQLARYAQAPTVTRDIELGSYRLRVDVPKKATAYDVVPINYTLSWQKAGAAFPVAIEATAFEDEERRKGRDLFDLALPGKLDLEVEYLGSITAHLTPEKRHNLKPDMSDEPGEYPAFERKPFVRSGVVEAGDLVWFRFRVTNTGNTILDLEGMGGCLWYPEIYRKNAEGEWEFYGHPYNLYCRDLEYLYPGESHELWVHFTKWPYGAGQNFGLGPGEYRINMRMSYRWYREFDPFCNIWDGPPMYVYEQPITVEREPRQAPVPEGKVTLTDGDEPDKITRWMHTFQEFMTAFDCYIKEPESASSLQPSPSGEAKPLAGSTSEREGVVRGTLYLQVAPWTEQVVVKLISTEPVDIRTAAVPIDVDSESLSVDFNPKHAMTVVKDGLREPAIWSQCMSDMRANVQIGPFPDHHIPERMREMMDCGINVVSFTSMPWLYDDITSPKSNYQGDAWKYFLDCARQQGLLAEGWGAYPYDRSTIQGISNWITGKDIKLETCDPGSPCISHSEPALPAANADAWLYQFYRWGDLYYQMERGDVPIGVEDTRGWMRQDNNIRYPEGELTVKAFREWVKAKYGSINAVNAAWGSAYKSFDEIAPEANQVRNRFGHIWEYSNPENVFRDWNVAVDDWDRFRTELRVKNYKSTLEIVRREIPTAKCLLRTEGGNVLVRGIDPEDPNPHLRHIYYSQRRCAVIAEILQESGAVKWHSDYTTMPYTPSELRKLTRMAVEQGIIPIYLPQFDNMRDIAINEKYGTPFEGHYNLPKPKKGQIIHVLTALYPWFKAVYEEGGVPGILWEDYQCDGFATETQKREMRFFKKKLDAAMNTPAARKARAEDLHMPSQDWRGKSRALPSYRLPRLASPAPGKD